MLNKIFKWLQGRTTAFCIMFFVTGNVLQIFHRLDATYISFMGVLLGYILGHSIKEDVTTPTVPAAAPAAPADTDKG